MQAETKDATSKCFSVSGALWDAKLISDELRFFLFYHRYYALY